MMVSGWLSSGSGGKLGDSQTDTETDTKTDRQTRRGSCARRGPRVSWAAPLEPSEQPGCLALGGSQELAEAEAGRSSDPGPAPRPAGPAPSWAVRLCGEEGGRPLPREAERVLCSSASPAFPPLPLGLQMPGE